MIRRKESAEDEVRRVLAEQSRRARSLLGQWKDDPRNNVHQARQSFKRIRALLRLIKPGARYVYRVENQFFRDLGRGLAYARDTEAVIDALGLVEVRVSGPLAQDSLRMLRVGLQQRAARERDSAMHDFNGRIEGACEALADAEKRFRHLPLEELRVKHFRRGAQGTLARCAEAFQQATQTGAAEAFHSWRKEVKYAYHQTRLMQQIMPRWARARGPALEQLADTLGHYHDLVVLETLLRTQADELNVDVHLRSMRNAVRSAKAEIGDSALVQGREVFGGRKAVADELATVASRA
jgi:CHAD domain-containing protein